MWPRVHNLDVRVEAAAGGFTVRVEGPALVGEHTAPPGRFVPNDLTPSFEDGVLLTDGRGNEPGWAADAGRRLFDTVFGTDAGPSTPRGRLRRAVRMAADVGHAVRVLVKYDAPAADPHRLHELPWELLCDAGGGGVGFVAVGPHTTFARYLCQGVQVQSLRVPAGPVRVLFTDACPTPPRLNTSGDREAVERAARAAPGHLECKAVPDVTRRELTRQLARARTLASPFHVWHHAGHGGMADGQFALALGAVGRAEHVGVRALLDGVPDLSDLRLAFLNVCHGGAADGLATALAGVNVPAVIGHRTKARDGAAVAFAAAVYRRLLSDALDVAVWAARRDLMAAGLAGGRAASGRCRCSSCGRTRPT